MMSPLLMVSTWLSLLLLMVVLPILTSMTVVLLPVPPFLHALINSKSRIALVTLLPVTLLAVNMAPLNTAAQAPITLLKLAKLVNTLTLLNKLALMSTVMLTTTPPLPTPVPPAVVILSLSVPKLFFKMFV